MKSDFLAATVLVTAAAIAIGGCATTPTPAPPPLDVKIVNGRIIDGTGAPWFRGDIGIRGRAIAAIGDLADVPAVTTIDARGLAVAPGFIDLLGQSQGSVFADPTVEAKVRQGITTEITGEGHSPGPRKEASSEQPWTTLGGYLDALQARRPAINFGLLVGASNPRQMVIGNVNRTATEDELRTMQQIVDQAMREGALGISTSLIYLPAMYSTTEEIVALAKVAAKYGGVYFTHLRDEGDRIDMGLDEAFRVGREAAIPVNIWHLKVGGRKNWGRMPHVVGRIAGERVAGLDVAANIYPYPASSTSLSTLAPDWAMEGGYGAFRDRLKNPEERERIRTEFRRQIERRGPGGIYVARIGNPAGKQYEKKFLEKISEEAGLLPEDALLKIFEDNPSSPAAIYFSMSEDDVRTAVMQPWISVGADSGSPSPAARAAGSAIHPRAYGTFPRILAKYVREEKLFSVEEAVRRFSSQAAARVNLHDRGVLRPGMIADVVVFDPDTIADKSTFDDPHHFSVGVEHVIVNGTPVLRDGKLTGAFPGEVLRGKGYKR
ncbi:MAG: D-aminoacylase [Thermoanaerobaculia bacterium]